MVILTTTSTLDATSKLFSVTDISSPSAFSAVMEKCSPLKVIVLESGLLVAVMNTAGGAGTV